MALTIEEARRKLAQYRQRGDTLWNTVDKSIACLLDDAEFEGSSSAGTYSEEIKALALVCYLAELKELRVAAPSKPSDAVSELAPSEGTPESKGASEGNLGQAGYDHPDCICTETTYGKQCPVEGHMPPSLIGYDPGLDSIATVPVEPEHEFKWECDGCGEGWHEFVNNQPSGRCFNCGSRSARFVGCGDDGQS